MNKPSESAPSGTNWHDLGTRLLSAAIMLPLAFGGIWAGGVFYDVLIVFVTLGIVYEGAALLLRRRSADIGLLGWVVFANVGVLLVGWIGHLDPMTEILFLALMFVAGPRVGLLAVIAMIGGLSLLWLRDLPHWGLVSVLFVLCIVITSDTSAYAAGRIFGGAKLAPRISPGKTRSGALGGLVGAAIVGGVVAQLAAPGTWLGGLITGLVLGVASQCGDLAESAFKRRLGVKDSSRLIPGHGGLLDRLDGLLAAAPLAALISMAVTDGLTGGPFWTVLS
ncbi:phosphatidate cytidylyltransferase [Brytella acorum]|uniref:Phosphatidate cytidylyltransferase n=1 Tax=Brytella acorum TaxID=2959299 RepID=A0AA35V3T6_9PROT|nr:CDP-archaeol synthase [Brytella acorum]MDF3625556.1 CDP-archaeol synthase [Brytella acorum]CAI9119423.1 CDP-archaeol synthase [Brytella acorum]